MKNKIALTVIAIAALSGSAMAQMHQNNQRHNMDGNCDYMSKEIQLTDEQRTQMKALHESMRTENQAAREARRTEMNKFYDNPTFNADEAKALAQKHRDDRAVRKMKHRHAMNQILTPEQRAQHAQMMQNHQNNRHMKGQKGEHHMNNHGHKNHHNN